MQTPTTQITQIPLEKLHPHPKNANAMSAATMKKLLRHVEASGRYEPLIVRPHPEIAETFQLINGHHRKQILAKLGHTHANCIVWELSDAETLLLLATINRLGGEDAPSKRLDLLDSLAQALARSTTELAMLLPEDEATLDGLLKRSAAEPIAQLPKLADMPEAFTVFMSAEQKGLLVAALAKTDADPVAALLKWAAAVVKWLNS